MPGKCDVANTGTGISVAYHFIDFYVMTLRRWIERIRYPGYGEGWDLFGTNMGSGHHAEDVNNAIRDALGTGALLSKQAYW
jgi:hypothetical protein